MKESKFTAAKVATLGMLAAISTVLVLFVHFPIFPTATFLEYDPADIPILIGTFLFGPWSGLLLTFVVCLIQGFTVSFAMGGMSGILMHLWPRRHGAGGRIHLSAWQEPQACHCGPHCRRSDHDGGHDPLQPHHHPQAFTGAPVNAVADMLLPIIVPFNLIKAGANCLVTFFVYKPIQQALQARKKGRARVVHRKRNR